MNCSTGISLEGMMLKLKLQYFGHLMRRVDSLEKPLVLECMKVKSESEVAQFSSVSQSCPTLFDPMNRSTPGLPVHHQLQEFTQTHTYR